jgi:beta-N-acetylhexosaminidase
MKAITNEYSAGDAAVLAVQAGNDMILDPPDVKAAADGVIQAVKDGKISEDRIDDSVRRIIEAKLKLKN